MLDRTVDTPAPRSREPHPRKDAHKKSAPKVVPAIIGIFIIAMVIGLVMKGRGSRGTCIYDHVYRKATCRTKQLTRIPPDINDHILSLVIGNKLDKAENHFITLSRKNFTKFRQLQELKMVKCGIEDIQPETFADLQSLHKLDLRYNRIQTIGEDTFRGLVSLDFIYLSNNPIKALPDFVFRGLRMEHLVFGNNPALAEMSAKTFAGASVKTLVLHRCSIPALPGECLGHLSDSLRELYITNNMIPLELSDDALNGLKLHKLTMANNGIKEADFLEQVIAEEINLDDNPLEEIDFDDSPLLKHTTRLSLSRTKLSRLTRENLSMLVNLKEFDLEGNDISVLNATEFDKLDNLEILDLSSNDLELFDGDFDSEFPSLKALYLDDNDIQTLPDSLEPLFSRLSNLTLHQNPLHCNCELRWFIKWIERNRDTIQELHAVECETPESRNLTHISDYGFQCNAPTILNSTFDADGISLVCTAAGDPAPVVTWLSPTGEETFTQPSRSHRRNFQTASFVTVTKDGNYTCVASNVEGDDSVIVDTRKIPTSGIKFAVVSDEIKILESPQGFWITTALICLLFYILKQH